MQLSMEEGSGPILYWMGWPPLLAWAASSLFTSPRMRPGSTVTLLPSPCGSWVGGGCEGRAVERPRLRSWRRGALASSSCAAPSSGQSLHHPLSPDPRPAPTAHTPPTHTPPPRPHVDGEVAEVLARVAELQQHAVSDRLPRQAGARGAERDGHAVLRRDGQHAADLRLIVHLRGAGWREEGGHTGGQAAVVDGRAAAPVTSGLAAACAPRIAPTPLPCTLLRVWPGLCGWRAPSLAGRPGAAP